MKIKVDEIAAKAKEILSSKYSSKVPQVEVAMDKGTFYDFVRIRLKNESILSYKDMQKFQRCFAKSSAYSVNVSVARDWEEESDYLLVYIDADGLNPKYVVDES